MMSGSGADRRRLAGGHDHDHDHDHDNGDGDDEGDEETSIMQFKDVSTKTPVYLVNASIEYFQEPENRI
jgi:hypothetical protein